jgi:peptidoglycan/LPS O-acetylase OafA/YrhL
MTLHPAWRRYRRLAFLAVIGFAIFMAWIPVQHHPFVQRNPWLTLFPLAAFAVGGTAWAGLCFFRCPMCGSTFHMKPGTLFFSFSKCQHCGLPLWATPPG